MSQLSSPGVPFAFFSSLIREIAKIRPVSTNNRTTKAVSTYPARQVFQNWVNELRKRFSPLPADTTVTCFRFLFPEEDVHRKYDMQETRLSGLLAKALGVESKDFEQWAMEEATGCLGQELKTVLERASTEIDPSDSLTIAEVDKLLNELASTSPFSHSSIRSKSNRSLRTRSEILRSLFRPLSPEDASIVAQIILKDMRPLLYPLTEFHYSTALTMFNSTSVKMLIKEHAMYVWDPSGAMLRFYRVRSSLYEACAYVDLPERSRPQVHPKVGSLISIPKSEKGQGCEDALRRLASSSFAWAETKYDGERAQIHIELEKDRSPRITIFSKSGRDSTMDRKGVHDILCSTLGLHESPKFQLNVVLDAEMVACKGDKIEEFWRIRQLVEDTAWGVRGSRKRRHVAVEDDVRGSMRSDLNEGFNLALVFFDILVLDSKSLLSQHYSKRRKILENLISVQPGKAMLAERYPIDLTEPNSNLTLRRIFADHLASHEEGLVLKADDSAYNDFRKPWVKLKKDYIPGYGDTLDPVLIGAGWEKVRGRSLRVPPTTFTTFYVGVLTNKSSSMQKSGRPDFYVHFTVSYGLNREQLEELNFLIKSADPLRYSDLDPAGLPFTFTIPNELKPLPTIILQTPLVVDLFGAGFTKSLHSNYYELRFPRITKVYRPSERDWRDSVDADELHRIACASVGRDPVEKDINDWCNELWGKPVSPKANSPRKRRALAEYWDLNLSALEGGSDLPLQKPCFNLSLIKKGDIPRKRPSLSIPRAESWDLDVSRHEAGPSRLPQQPCFSLSPVNKGEDLRTFGPSSTGTVNEGLVQHIEEPNPFLVEDPLSNALFWFPKLHQGDGCQSWRRRRKATPPDRRLHSLASLLAACDPNHVAQPGVIVVDECDTITEDLMSILSSKIPRGGTRPILVFGCKSQSVPIYRLE